MRRFGWMFLVVLCLATSAHASPSSDRKAIGAVVATQVGQKIEGVVTVVKDGDTVIFKTPKGDVDVRLYGIDAPETKKNKKKLGQPYGEEAKAFLSQMVLNEKVVLEVTGSGNYGRVGGILHHNGDDVNATLIRSGLAWAYKEYLKGPHASEYLGLEEVARKEKLGLWKQSNPQPPWEYRKLNK